MKFGILGDCIGQVQYSSSQWISKI